MAKIKRKYVWEIPVRFYHWVNATCILVLVVTGYIIGNPPAIQHGTEAYANYWFGINRFIHFVFSYLFFFNFVLRLYWAFVGNKYSKWWNFVPYTKRQWKEIGEVLKVDILQLKTWSFESEGHNALASFTYFIMFLAFLLQCLTGFGMYAAMSTSWFPQLFAWFIPLVGGDMAARHIHHILMWIFVVFAMIHIYLVFYHDYVERTGVASSMISGWKFVTGEKHED
jgi:Ni/Fe-hydrogenase 1 B-type cytochrome subunit